MLNAETKKHIDAARDVLVGVAPNPMTQIDQITYALIYKFMDDMDQAAIKAGGEPSFFTGELEPYAWSKLVDSRMGNQEKMNLYGEALQKFAEVKQLPELFRTIFRAAFLPYRSPETLGLFLKEINFFDYSHPEELGNAYEYLLSIMSAQGDAGQFRTPRHIIDFIVDVINPTKDDTVLDPACGTGGFLVASYNHILEQHDGKNDPSNQEKPLTPDERKKLMNNFEGYDIDPSMVRIAQVNMYLHQFKNPKIFQYDSLTNEERWNDKFDVILANPPFMSPRGGIKPHNKFARQSNRSEVLFVDYIANHLKPNGRAGIIVPEGVIYHSGKAYKQLRKNLIEDGLFAVVSLPSGIFQPYSPVKTSILFIDKSKAREFSKVAFVEVASDGTDLGAKRKATEQNDLPSIVRDLEYFLGGNSQTESLNLVEKSLLFENSNVDLTYGRYKVIDRSAAHGTWVNLGTLLEESKIRVKEIGNLPVWSVSNKLGFVNSKEYFEKDVPSDDISNYKVVNPNSIAYNPSRINVGSIAINKSFIRGCVSPMYVVFGNANPNQLNFDYLSHLLKSSNFNSQVMNRAQGAVREQLKYKDLAEIQIPLPTLEVQEQIVAELDGYAAIIDGAKKIVENWKPRIDVDSEWSKVELGEVLTLEYGKPLKEQVRINGRFPVFGSNGQVGTHSEYLVEGPFIVIGRKGSAGAVTWSEESGFPIDTTFYVNILEKDSHDLRFVFAQLKSMSLDKVNTQSGVPGLNRNDAYKLSYYYPDIELQRRIADEIQREQKVVSDTQSLIARYESRISKVINGLWNE